MIQRQNGKHRCMAVAQTQNGNFLVTPTVHDKVSMGNANLSCILSIPTVYSYDSYKISHTDDISTNMN